MTYQSEKRVFYYDFLRVFATLGVIVLHAAAQNYENVDISSFEWNIFNIVDASVRWAVPIFVMISGALFLDNQKPLEIKKLYSHNILKLLTALIFWSAVYALNKYLLGADIKKAINSFIKGHYHLWFLYMIIGLYIIVPILRKITSSKKITEYFLLIGFIFTFFIPRSINFIELLGLPISAIDTAFSNVNFHLTNGYVFYFILGFYLSKYDVIKTGRRITSISIWGIGYLATVLATYWWSNKLGTAYTSFYDNFSTTVLLTSIGVFLSAKYMSFKFLVSKIPLGIFQKISKHSFGIYLVHALVMDKFDEWLNLNSLTYNPVISITVLVLGISIVSYIISAALNHIPKLGKYIT